MDWSLIEKQAVVWLQELLRFNTSNPPGNEKPALLYVKKIAEQHDLYTEFHKTEENRGNLIIKMSGESCEGKEPIILLSHIDVVPANAADWTFPPFEGVIRNNRIYGRGAVDTKQLTIIHLMTMILLKRKDGHAPQAMMVVTSDEECGSHNGLLAMLQKQSPLFTGATVFNEGGGFPLKIDGKLFYLCETGQKGRALIKVKTRKKKGGSPYLPDDTNIRNAAAAVERFAMDDADIAIPLSTKKMFKKMGDDIGIFLNTEKDFNLWLNELPSTTHRLFKAMTRTTYSVTQWRSGTEVMEGSVDNEIGIDCRTLPSWGLKDLEEHLYLLMEGLDVSWEVHMFQKGFETKVDEEVFTTLKKVLQEELPEAELVPFISIGGSDSRYLRDSNVYGYCPVLPDMTFDQVLPLVHGVDEYMTINSITFGIRQFYEMIPLIDRRIRNAARKSTTH